jgi:hypothetical protein
MLRWNQTKHASSDRQLKKIGGELRSATAIHQTVGNGAKRKIRHRYRRVQDEYGRLFNYIESRCCILSLNLLLGWNHEGGTSMSMLSHFLDPAELAQLNDAQVAALNDHFDAALMKEVFTNQGLQQNLKQSLAPAVKAHLSKP